MGYTKDILDRATVIGLTSYLLSDFKAPIDNRDYETRLKESYKEFEHIVKTEIENVPSSLFDAVNALLSDYIDVYTEIGLRSGILLSQDISRN